MTPGGNPLTTALYHAARLPFRFKARQTVAPPRKALILQPCCLGRVMQTTPLLAALSDAFPDARFDWAISEWALQAVSSNPRITRTIHSGAGDVSTNSREEMQAFFETVRAEGYDTCFIPSRSSELARVAWQTGIPQRIGLNEAGRGFAHTVAVSPPAGERQVARLYLALAAAAGVDESILAAAEMEFHPTDSDRTAVTRWLVEELDWLGDQPLLVLHPGGGENPSEANLNKRWPAQRFARLTNHLTRSHNVKVVIVGTTKERRLAEEVAGMMSFPVSNRAGHLGLGELGALCELAGLYVGNDVGSTYVAAATGCPTLSIYGPTDPRVYAPYMVNGRVRTLWRPYEGAFDWDAGVSVEEASAAAEELLAAQTLLSNGRS
ncbi:MAG: glycosyltransferase family 9 protein [Anaerolineae bacterium]|uniref:glycosyltransferase family 9 protein n=1 Tax=Promineifilum sp. TaxID=2664178 RepID=UPI001D30E029|nr:glycosyltransferase family 9 protein [Anaerolineales bacterium]MCB8934051.1 glycosyltransferase family 9 protein [Promineifilum sp.]MCO5179451.1 glycosyltransferase family 9 protein [Promineifilum sp.]MCW5845833.1 glycosyltransferase family 9 protein [Anaerolineae bacterium]